MARPIAEANLAARATRTKLKIGRQAHWRTIIPGRAALGYRRKGKKVAGTWLLRRWIDSTYRVVALGIADDFAEADGDRVLNFAQAGKKADAVADGGEARPVYRMTVRRALADYIDFRQAEGASARSIDDTERRAVAHILPTLGDKEVAGLTAPALRRWLANLAATPAMKRSKAGAARGYKPAGTDDETIRRRRSSANRVLAILKAALNFAYDENRTPSNDAWGRRLKPFRNVDGVRLRHLNVAEAKRLINAADAEFRPLLHAALQTGARYSELARLEVQDFDPDSGTVHIRKSKSGKARHVVLTDEGIRFFKGVTAGRGGAETMLRHDDGEPWLASQQARPMHEAVERARISPPISLHGMRHTWASLAVRAGMPLMIVAKNMGHANTTMVEKHYGHLAPSFISDSIAAHAPRFGAVAKGNVRTLR